MAHLPAAVCVITTAGPHGRLGLTANAVSSVTDTPPTVLVCINRSSATHGIFRDNAALCINVLAESQQELADHFSGRTAVSMEQRFTWDVWGPSVFSQPTLREATVALQGQIAEWVDVGSYTAFFVRGREVRVREGGAA